MATGITTYAGSSALINAIYEGSLLTLRSMNLLVPTVQVFTDQSGLAPRKVTSRPSANVRARGEGEDITPTKFDKSLLNTLTPAIYSDQFFITDQDIRSENESVRDQASMELGAAFAENIDTNIASNFASLTGGTIGSAGGTILWPNIIAAKAKLRQAKVPGPYYCVLGDGQWYHLLVNSGTVDNSISRAQAFAEELVDNYYVTSKLGDVVFVVCPNVSGAGGTAAYGAMYARLAMAYDERMAYYIEPQRDASRTGTELNANMEYAHGVWAPTRGVQIIGTDVVPTS